MDVASQIEMPKGAPKEKADSKKAASKKAASKKAASKKPAKDISKSRKPKDAEKAKHAGKMLQMASSLGPG